MSLWRLFAPAEEWRDPLQVDESLLPMLTEIAHRLTLRVSRDDAQKKFFLGLPGEQKPPVPAGDGVLYPSGKRLEKAKVSEAEAARYGTTGIYDAAPLMAAQKGDALSDHFKAGEFFPNDASYHFLRVSPELVGRLEKIRSALGDVAITIHSAYRPPDYNRQVGGVSNSAHIDGLAADISAEGISTADLYQVCQAVIGNDGGVGYYPTQQFCHVDVRGSAARWSG